MRPKSLTMNTYAAADPNGVSVSQTPAAGGIQALTITGALASGGSVTFDTPRQVAITSAADETARVFIVKGTSRPGVNIIEAIVGVDTGVFSTVQAFATVTEILVDDDTTGAVEAGTLLVVQTNWFPMDYQADPAGIALAINIGAATADVTVLLALGRLGWNGQSPDPNVGSWRGSDFGRIYPSITPYDHDTLVNIVATTTGNVGFPITALRLQSNAVITSGPVILEISQASRARN